MTLFLLAALIFPDKIEEYDGYEDFFLKRRHWFFSILGATFLLDVLDTLLKGEPYFDTLGVRLPDPGPHGLLLCGLAIWTGPARPAGAGAGSPAYQVWWDRPALSRPRLMQRVLFVCGANRLRSPTAEHVFPAIQGSRCARQACRTTPSIRSLRSTSRVSIRSSSWRRPTRPSCRSASVATSARPR